MPYVMYFYDRSNYEIYRKVIFWGGSETSKCLWSIANGEIADGFDEISEADYDAMIESGEWVEADDLEVFDLT